MSEENIITPVALENISQKVIIETLKASQNKSSIDNVLDQKAYVNDLVLKEVKATEEKALKLFSEKLANVSSDYIKQKDEEALINNQKKTASVAELNEKISSLQGSLKSLINTFNTNNSSSEIIDTKKKLYECLTNKETATKPLLCYDIVNELKKLSGK
ncbi:uncharacterized protein HGUI_01080 [Hanseniaspora guilliermondii]|uniref:MICOS complex subunit MIC19 n=1 Tax=Hanseniaspora guilliermondii TaxID=56406 RepID=A0A1L0AXT5_9ASCO|nr:uncharacterized protein HGUI_01080 [Hanseniaspora guilliermondii]